MMSILVNMLIRPDINRKVQGPKRQRQQPPKKPFKKEQTPPKKNTKLPEFEFYD